MIGRADIEESKSNVDMNSWLPQASYTLVIFLTPLLRRVRLCGCKKGSIGLAFAVGIGTENANERSFCPFVRHEISVLIELLLGHLCYRFTDVPPQPNSPPVCVIVKGIPV